MRGESYFIGMRSLGQQGHFPEDGGLLLLCCIDRDWAVTRCFAEEAFQAITDFNDLPNSLFACNVHQSVFEGEESKVMSLFYSGIMGRCGIIPEYFRGLFVIDGLKFWKMCGCLCSWHAEQEEKSLFCYQRTVTRLWMLNQLSSSETHGPIRASGVRNSDCRRYPLG